MGRLEGRIAVADSAVIAVDRKAQWLERILIVGWPALGRLCFLPSKEENVRLLF